MDALRAPVDELEMIVDKDVWPMPSYGDLIFELSEEHKQALEQFNGIDL